MTRSPARSHQSLFAFTAVTTLVLAAAHSSAAVLTRQGDEAPHRGVYEIDLEAEAGDRNPYFDVDLRVFFIRPDETRVTADGFYDGGRTFKARAYCDTLGVWQWRSISNVPELNGRQGQFRVVASQLNGKLRKHPDDPRQFAYDSGRWFFHIGDTGYRFVTDTEPEWKAYIDQAAETGVTKIRTWFCQARSDVQVLFADDRAAMNLPYWQEIDHRLTYALNNHPHVIFQLIPFGEDTAEIARYGQGDRASVLVGRYAQARFSAFPNVYWCLTNDRNIISRTPMRGRDTSPYVVNRMAMDFYRREPWGTLITNHQRRFQGYSFVNEPWSDIITIEDLDQVAGAVILHYRRLGDDPVINDEDRYELYRPPAHPRYFFRRLMWASLFSGGAATYGGLKTYEVYDGDLRGVQGYADAVKAGKLVGGARDFRHIHKFFEDTDLTLVGMEPADEMVGYQPHRFKCIRDEDHILVYLQNPDGLDPDKADVAATHAAVKVHLPQASYGVRWYQPTSGQWMQDAEFEEVAGQGEHRLKAPFAGDAILYLKRH
ncbi:MAG: apiosidase-like domain-containing protein [Planctomycetota bacterium]|jgi:hypothetical protein